MTDEDVYIQKFPLMEGLVEIQFTRQGHQMRVSLSTKGLAPVYAIVLEAMVIPKLTPVFQFLTLLDIQDVDITQGEFLRALESMILKDLSGYREFQDRMMGKLSEGDLSVEDIMDELRRVAEDAENPSFFIRSPGEQEKEDEVSPDPGSETE